MSAIEREILTQPADWRHAAARLAPDCRRCSAARRAGRGGRLRHVAVHGPGLRRGRARRRARRDRRLPRLRDAGRPALRPPGRDLPLGHDQRGACGCSSAARRRHADPRDHRRRRLAVRRAGGGRGRARLRRRGVGRPDPVCDHRARAPAGGDRRRHRCRGRRGRRALTEPAARPDRRTSRFAFLGAGWTVGLANEAALKLREAAGAWAEAYPAMEYRHGPISANADDTLVWPIGARRPRRARRRRPRRLAPSPRTAPARSPSLVLAQRVAVALARARNLDPDHPHSLTRSVVLP